METEFISLKWIPWKRYVLRIRIDDGRPIFLGRFRLAKTARREQLRLSVYAGYAPEVIDTKELEEKGGSYV